MARVTTTMAAGLGGRLDDLRAKLAARQDRPGFKRNAQRIRAEIARLEQEASHG
jgi:hypothetical protein